MKTLYKHCIVGLVCSVVLLMQTTGSIFARSTEKKHFVKHLLLHKKKVKSTGIEMKGRIQNEEGTMSDVTVNVFIGGELYLTTTSNNFGKCKFTLPLDQKYTIVFSMPGYLTKKIVVNAKVPSSEMELSTFHFTIDMLKETLTEYKPDTVQR